MTKISVRVPQLGEGLHEAILVKWLKQPGQWVRRDEPLYQMETDKAVTDMESPSDGLLVETLVDEGAVVQIGEAVAQLDSSVPPADVPAEPTESTDSADERRGAGDNRTVGGVPTGDRNRDLPPRTRAYLKSKRLLDRVDQIPRRGSRLTPEDVDAYLADRGLEAETSARSDATLPTRETHPEFTEVELPKSQQILNHRMARAAQVAVPATLFSDVDWSAIETTAQTQPGGSGENSPSAFLVFLWHLVQTTRHSPVFRSSLSGSGRTLRTAAHVNLGIAVARPDHQLVTAVVPAAEALEFREFAQLAEAQIEAARAGHDQADESVTLTVSNVGSLGMRSGIPVLVPPAVATLAVGRAEWHAVPGPGGCEFEKRAALTLVFDHRIANGSVAAEFLTRLRNQVARGLVLCHSQNLGLDPSAGTR